MKKQQRFVSGMMALTLLSQLYGPAAGAVDFKNMGVGLLKSLGLGAKVVVSDTAREGLAHLPAATGPRSPAGRDHSSQLLQPSSEVDRDVDKDIG